MPIEISLPAAVPLSNAALDPPLLLQSLGCSPRELNDSRLLQIESL